MKRKKDKATILIPKSFTSGAVPGYRLFSSMHDTGINVGSNARWILTSDSSGLMTSGEKRVVNLVRRKLSDLFVEKPTIMEIQAKVRKVGNLLRPEDPPNLRSQFKDQSLNDYFWPITELISMPNGDRPGLFFLFRNVGGLWIEAMSIDPRAKWGLAQGIVYAEI